MPAGATYEPIATTTLGSSQASITFNSLGSYTDLRLIVVARTTFATNNDTFIVRFNSDTANNYSTTWLQGSGTAASSVRNSTIGYINGPYVPGSTAGANIFSYGSVDIFSYGGSTNKTVLIQGSQDLNGSGNVYRGVGLWRSTSAITSVIIYGENGSFATGTTATLYGIKAA